MRNPSYLIIGLALLALSLVGCKPSKNEPALVESASSQPQHFKKNSGEPENFNRNIHVIRTLWNELSTLDPANEDQAEKYNLLLEALQKRMDKLNCSEAEFDQADRDLFAQVKEALEKTEQD